VYSQQVTSISVGAGGLNNYYYLMFFLIHKVVALNIFRFSTEIIMLFSRIAKNNPF